MKWNSQIKMMRKEFEGRGVCTGSVEMTVGI